jgi:transcriptional regulator with XRE-family HTH domain
MPDQLEQLRLAIAATVRQLRQAQRLSQAELATRLGLSQSRLSEIERGAGSFTAEQLLLLSPLFNVVPSDFASSKPADEHAELQNALARYGARHLRENDAVLSSSKLDVPRAIREALVSGVPRLVTALAPVLVMQIDRIRLTTIHAALAQAGLHHRLGWLLENVLASIRSELATQPPRVWSRRYRRAALVIETALEGAGFGPQGEPTADLLDADIRSAKTRRQVEAAASTISRRWGIVTVLSPEDFASALGAARVDA